MKIFNQIKNNRGFVILFAVTLASILLTISLGVSNIALREIKFSTSAKDTNDAFFAADTGTECALFNDKPPTRFPVAGPATPLTCASATPTYSAGSNTGLYSFKLEIGLTPIPAQPTFSDFIYFVPKILKRNRVVGFLIRRKNKKKILKYFLPY